jgi:superfamily II DNA or RNA helicase
MTNIGNRGYTLQKDKYSIDYINNIKNDLTLKPFSCVDYGAQSNEFCIYAESKKKLYLPRYFGFEKLGEPESYKLNMGEPANLNFNGSLKEIQKPIVDAYMESVNNKIVGGGVITIPCGYGKTVLGLYLASRLKLRTLVVVHKEFLLNQWIDRIKQFLPESSVGRIQSNIVRKDNDIVIGMLQSISMIEYPEDTFRDFGFVIFDECHHLGAEVFSRALFKTNARYTLGLSATPNRSDGLTKVFHWYLGPTLYSIKQRTDNNVKVKMIHFQDTNKEYCEVVLNFKKKPNSALMINNICNYEPRTNIIIDEIIESLKEKRKILVLSDRRNHLNTIYEKLVNLKETNENFNYTFGFYLGGMKPADLEKTEKMNVILGTFSMASEGFDCREPLNTIILASPKSNIEQAVGRILRQDEKDRKFIPLVIDIVDEFCSFKGQALKRYKFYNKNKYKIDVLNHFGETIKNIYVKKPTNKKNIEIEFLTSD